MGLEAAVIGGIIGGAGSVGGAAIGAGAAGSAADKQTAANRESMAAQKDAAAKASEYLKRYSSVARNDLQPLANAQTAGIQGLVGLTDPNNPYYQQQRDVNTQAIQRQLAAQGLLRSRAQADQLSNLELGLNQQRTGILGSLAGLGAIQQQSAGAQGLGQGLAGIQQMVGQQIGSAFQNQGQIQAQAGMQQANAWSGGLAGLGNAMQGIFNPAPTLAQTLAQLGLGGGGGPQGGYAANIMGNVKF